MPIAADQMDNFCLDAASGNYEAAHVLRSIAQIARLADDIADGDSRDPVRDLSHILRIFLVELAGNDFYRDHAAILAPVCLNALLGWEQSEEWAKSGNRKTRIFAFVYREAVEQVAHTVAYLTGGHDHARDIMRKLHELSHMASPETFEEWENEHGPIS